MISKHFFCIAFVSHIWPGVGARTPGPTFVARTATFCQDIATPGNYDFVLLRGGGQEATLDEKVHAAMKKLGLDPPPPESEASPLECEDGVCKIPPPPPPPRPEAAAAGVTGLSEEEAGTAAKEMAESLGVDLTLSWAALGATATVDEGTGSRTYHKEAAREMIEQELKIIEKVPADSAEVKQLVSEGYDTFLSRRALAFADSNVDDARAILLADKMDEEEEKKELAKTSLPVPPPPPPAEKEVQTRPAMKTVTVDKDFDPTKIDPNTKPSLPGAGPMKAAKRDDVVFEATAAQIQELVIESPVPVLLDVYADWCGPCKVLGPALEEMAVKGGGAFRLVKLNTDNERSVSGALEVQSLPTVFGVKDGKIQNMFMGMPRSEDAIKNFMMGLLMPGAKFDPPVTSEESEKYRELSGKLVKVAAASSYSFAARERLNDRIVGKLDELVEETGGVLGADSAATIIRSLLSNAMRDPYSEKFRTVNLENKVIADKVAKFQSCLAILKSVGFRMESDGSKMMLGKGRRVINVAPLNVAQDCIDKWIDKQRYEVAKANRKKKDEEDRVRVQAELDARRAEEPEAEEEEAEEVDPDACSLQVRIDGKKKVHDVSMHADDSLKDVVKKLPVEFKEGQITCVAKKLVVKSSDKKSMGKSLRELGLIPKASLVVALGTKNKEAVKSNLSQRAAEKTKKKTGSHTMQSVGIYSKDDNAKGELIDGGGGVMYEQDVTDDEEEKEEEEAETGGDAASEEVLESEYDEEYSDGDV